MFFRATTDHDDHDDSRSAASTDAAELDDDSAALVVSRLDHIVRVHREMAARDERSVAELLERTLVCTPSRDFSAALSAPGLSIISEVKRRSPSAGDLRNDLEPSVLAREYESGGAACLSVLTDVEFFGGSVSDLQSAREATAIPVLRKDFTVDERDVLDARLMGADAVLLIVAALSDAELMTFRELAEKLGMAALVEVHDANEIDRAAATGAKVLGVNQRDLETFAVDPTRAAALFDDLPAGVVTVAESAIETAEDTKRLRECGYDAVLIGSALLRSPDPRALLAEMVSS